MFKAALQRKPANKPARKGLSDLQLVQKYIAVAQKQLEAVIGDRCPIVNDIRLTHAMLLQKQFSSVVHITKEASKLASGASYPYF